MKPQIVRHGEVILKPIDTLPKEAELKRETKREIVAHSETGHHHVLEAPTMPFKVYMWNGETYLEIPEMSDLLHEKTGKDVHKTHKIIPATYKVVIKKSYDYFKKRMERVRD